MLSEFHDFREQKEKEISKLLKRVKDLESIQHSARPLNSKTIGEMEHNQDLLEELDPVYMEGENEEAEISIESGNSEQELEMARKRTQTNRQNFVRRSILMDFHREEAQQSEQ